MLSKPRSFLALLQLGQVIGARAAQPYIWPSETDFLENLLYEQVGHEAFTPAAVVAPCGNVNLGKGRSVPAEWIRTAYHDMATADVVAGTGGMDASIGFELDRPENPGRSAFEETLLNMAQHLTSKSSMADLIALGTIASVGACSLGKVLIPLRAGRVDATKAGPTGVPEPQQGLDSHVASFKRQGFNKAEMIGLVACGHTMGGVHAEDFPEVVPVPGGGPAKGSQFTQTFDNTTENFDNIVASDFIKNNRQNILAFGHNETTRSDARIFNSDGKAEIKKLAGSNDYFLKTCSSLFERMINTVPKKVTLTPPIQPIAVKPMQLFATINSNGKMTFSGRIRLMDDFSGTPDRSVEIVFYPRSKADCAKTKSCIRTKALVDVQSWTATTYGLPPAYPLFRKYNFQVDLPISVGVSGFTVVVTDKVNGKFKTTTYDNGGKRFPFQDTVIAQPKLSCGGRFGRSLLNVTVAVRDDAKFNSISGAMEIPSSLTALVPHVKTIPMIFKKTGTVPKAGYTLYNAQQKYEKGSYRRMYNVVGKNDKNSVKNLFNNADDLQSC